MELSLSSSSFGVYGTSPHYTKSSINAKCKFYDTIFKSCPQKTNFYSIRRSSRIVSTSCPKRCSISACSGDVGSDSNSTVNQVADFRVALWRFLRPHTIYGTTIGSASLLTRALLENPNLVGWSLLFKAFSGLVALIYANGYIVGINQIYDIGIDEMNKPYLPIAAGDISVELAWYLVLSFAVVGLIIVGKDCGPFITSLYCLALSLGTIYSVPPFRLKRFPVAAFLIIATVRGFILNFGVYYAVRATLGLTFQWRFQIPTFATKLGVRNIALLGSGLLIINYIGSTVVAIYMPQAFRSSLMIPLHTILASCLIFQAWVLERGNYTKEATTTYYRFLWKLFYAEYIIFPFI